jgi:hypothetical protein
MPHAPQFIGSSIVLVHAVPHCDSGATHGLVSCGCMSASATSAAASASTTADSTSTTSGIASIIDASGDPESGDAHMHAPNVPSIPQICIPTCPSLHVHAIGVPTKQ